MLKALRRGTLRALSFFFSERMSRWVAKYLSRKSAAQIQGQTTDRFLELLLKALEASFILVPSFKKNLAGIKARYTFSTDDGKVGASMDVYNSKVRIHKQAKQGWTVRVRFSDSKALRSYLFSQNQDILDSILKDAVEVDGNINYIYRLGFWVKDLEKRLGVL